MGIQNITANSLSRLNLSTSCGGWNYSLNMTLLKLVFGIKLYIGR